MSETAKLALEIVKLGEVNVPKEVYNLALDVLKKELIRVL